MSEGMHSVLPIIVRPLTVLELPLLLELLHYDDPQRMLTECGREIESRTGDIYGLFEDERLLGELHARYASDDSLEAVLGRRVYLFAFRVRKERQGQGLGKRLMAQVLATLADQGYTEFTIGVEDDNAQARRLYLGFGFTEIIARKSESFQGRSYAYDLLLKRAEQAVQL